MIEISLIGVHVIIITIFCYSPKYLISYFNNNQKLDIIGHLEIGIILNIFLLLILSFIFRGNSNLIFYILIIVFLINLFFCINDFINYIKKNNQLIRPELLFLLLFAFILSVDLSNNLKLGWDGQNYWLVKKLIFSNGGDVFDLKLTPRDDYPYLGSFIWFLYSKISILNYEYFGRIFYIYLFLISIFSVSRIIKINLFEFLLLSSIIVFLIYKSSLFNGYQEIISFSLLVLLINNFYRILNNRLKKNKFNNNLLLTFLIICNLIWIKNESSIFAIIFILTFLTIKEFKINFKILFLVGCGILFLAKYYLFDLFNLSHDIQSGNYEHFKIENFFDFINIQRFFLVSQYLTFTFIEMLIYPLTIIFLIILLKFNKKNQFYNFLFYSFILNIVFLYAAFLLSYFPLEWVLKVSLYRIVFQSSAFFVILIPLFYNFLLNKYSKKI